ncbi:uncharacterized protein PV09_02896 [Verruconis gallopava]|uniref:DUF7708 domain-containing protein n=1 Tax=Verruconis gallopava TaxID=253628 RepID=A0A0D1Z0G9_9PEZI|nr:uncharacterized protein PV09_02896 [Verruconis gallopava]KIW06452.1 hypothetical protein PV09_02896 [Verruconis gallopava]
MSNFIPNVLKQRLTVDFMEKRIIPEKKLAVRYDRRRDSYVHDSRAVNSPELEEFFKSNEEVQLWKQIEDDTKDWLEEVHNLSQSEKKEFIVADANFQAVIDTVKKVQDEYYSKDTMTAHMRDCFRKISGKAERVQPWLELLPDGAYKTLCGGLKLVVEVMKSHTKIRELILDLIAELPDIASHAQNYIDIYGKNVNGAVTMVFLRILSVLKEVVRWYREKKWKRFGQAAFHGSQFGKSIVDGINDLRKATAHLEAVTQQCLHRSVKQGLKNGEEAAVNLAQRMDELLQTCMEQRKYTQQFNEIIYECFKSICTNMSSLREFVNLSTQPNLPERYSTTLLSATEGYSLDQLYETISLKVNMIHPGAFEKIIRQGTAQCSRFLAQAQWFLASSTFGEWIRSTKSSTILLKGGQPTMERYSPLTYVCAMFAERMSQEESVLVLPVFCGLVNWDEDEYNPDVAIFGFMIRQMLARSKIERLSSDMQRLVLSCLDKTTLNGMKRKSSEAYKRAFRRLITQIRNAFSEIFIILDGIEFLETRDDIDMLAIYALFSQVVDNFQDTQGFEGIWSHKGPPTAIKVLYCASTRTIGFESPGRTAMVLELTGRVDEEYSYFGDERQGLDTVATRTELIKMLEASEALEDSDGNYSD